MNIEQRKRENLTGFLADRGIAAEELLKHVDNVFGEPHLVVASGSVIEGFGNPRSDVDILVLVDSRAVTDVPVSAYEGQQILDVTYLDSAWALETGKAVVEGRLFDGIPDGDTWRRVYRDVEVFSRLQLGLVLAGDQEWRDWMEAMRLGGLSAAIRRWWLVDAVRYWCTARLLTETKPLVAHQRYCDAALAALNVRMCDAGELYWSHKWLAEKLIRVGDGEGLAAYRRTLNVPLPGEDNTAYIKAAEALLAEHLPDSVRPETVELIARYPDEVSVLRFQGHTLVTRSMIGGLEIVGAQVPDDGTDEPLWAGRLAEMPDHIRELALADLVWLGVTDGSVA
jgi:predicted nucleotidyltransferase